MARVGLIFGGRSAEHAVSVSSARTVRRALAAAGHEVIPLGIAPDGCWVAPDVGRQLLDDPSRDCLEPAGEAVAPTLRHLLAARLEVAFPIVHGTWGEDGSLQGLLEMLDLPYAGAGVAASAVAMDKLLAKQILAAHGIPVVPYAVVTAADRTETVHPGLRDLGLPLFVKPCTGGSSVGVSRVAAWDDLAGAVAHGLRFDDRVLVERGIDGRELECAVLGDERLEASAVGEIVPGKEFYDYADKYLDDRARLIAPAELDGALAERLQQLAVAAFAAIGGHGMARVDFLLAGDGEELYVNEINTLPGFTDISMYPRLWELSGLPLPRLADRLVEIARRRHRRRARLDRGIKEFIEEIAR
ncbi:MAG: D-alanine--D-alanine ligase [Acidobacteria bacterium]|nr:MAG: D-alanine--D-alanine ligase [Acidobacteriota bacterium]